MKTLTRSIMLGLLIAVTGLALVTSTGISQNDQPLEGVTVQQGNASWVSAAPVTQIGKQLMEELGATVEVQNFGSNSIAYSSMNLGDTDFWMNGWFPLHNPQVPQDFKATIFEPHCPGCTTEGYLINVEAIQEFEITSLEDFRGNEELKSAFDENGDGKADLFGCPPGWGCNGIINDHFELYDWFSETFNHVSASYAANFSTAQARINNGEPALYYTWRPNNTVLQLVPGEDVKYVNLVENKEDLKKADAYASLPKDALIAELGNEGVTDTVNLGFAAGDIRAVANNNFLENNPAAEELLKQIKTEQQWINEATAKIKQEDADPANLAAQWIEDNRDKVDEWLNAARGAASGMN